MIWVILMILGTIILLFIIGCFFIGAWAHHNDLKFEKNKEGKTVLSYRPDNFGVSKNSTKDK